MSIFRIYVDRHTGIANGVYQSLSESNNQSVQLFAGGDGNGNNVFSRHLINLDLTELQQKISSTEINTAFTISYVLHFKNGGPSTEEMNSSIFSNSTNAIATSYDLIFFQIDKEFDSSTFGYDFDKALYLTRQPGNFIFSGVANFLSASTTNSWTEPGVWLHPTAHTYSTQHFQTTEDICVDVSNIVNNILSTGGTSCNIGICFSETFENNTGKTRYFANFFSDKTNSFFKPYLDVNYNNQVIVDDRMQVTNNRMSRLFLYTFSGNVSTNYFSAGTVNITNSNNAIVISGITPTNFSKGVYYIDFLLSSSTKGQLFKDVWQNVTFAPGIDQTTFTQQFVVQNNYYTSNAKQINDYVTDIYGINNNETIQSGDIKRVYVDTRINYSNSKPFVNPRVDYRLYCSLQEIIPWTQINLSVFNAGHTSNWFDLDTSWLLNAQTYNIQFRINELGTLRTLPDILNFRVVDEINKIKIS